MSGEVKTQRAEVSWTVWIRGADEIGYEPLESCSANVTPGSEVELDSTDQRILVFGANRGPSTVNVAVGDASQVVEEGKYFLFLTAHQGPLRARINP